MNITSERKDVFVDEIFEPLVIFFGILAAYIIVKHWKEPILKTLSRCILAKDVDDAEEINFVAAATDDLSMLASGFVEQRRLLLKAMKIGRVVIMNTYQEAVLNYAVFF